jgi:hypothetical protein
MPPEQQSLAVKIIESPKENALKTYAPLVISALSFLFSIVSLAVSYNGAHTSMRSSNYIDVFNLIQEQEALHSAVLKQYENLQRQEAALIIDKKIQRK